MRAQAGPLQATPTPLRALRPAMTYAEGLAATARCVLPGAPARSLFAPEEPGAAAPAEPAAAEGMPAAPAGEVIDLADVSRRGIADSVGGLRRV